MTEQDRGRRGVSRRALISSAGVGALAVVAGIIADARTSGAASAAEMPAPPHTASLADLAVDAFRRHHLVAIGEFHGQQEPHDALVGLLTDHDSPGSSTMWSSRAATRCTRT